MTKCKIVSKPMTLAAEKVIFWHQHMHSYTVCSNVPGGADECEVAADTYQCGRDVAPAITNQIFTTAKGGATVVNLFWSRLQFKNEVI